MFHPRYPKRFAYSSEGFIISVEIDEKVKRSKETRNKSS